MIRSIIPLTFTFISHSLSGNSANMPELVEIQSIHPNIQIDLKYATSDNFTGEVIYHFHKCLLVKEAAIQLGKVQVELEFQGKK